jgi:hypothetical protein
MYKTIIILLLWSILSFILGYNASFNTKKTNEKFLSLANYKKESYFYKLNTSQKSLFWIKVVGYTLMLFSLGLVILVIILMFSPARQRGDF